MDTWLSDVRYSFRALRANAGFTFAVVLTLSVAIGVTTGVFSVVDATLLRPLPFDPHGRIVALGSTSAESPSALQGVSTEELRDWQTQAQTMSALCGWRDWGMSRSDDGRRESVFAIVATAELFQVVPVQPVLGRLFSSEDDRPGRNRVVLISEAFWRERFGADGAAIGRTMVLERGPKAAYTIVGVLPATFNEIPSFERVKVVAPSSIDPDAASGRSVRNRRVFGRLRDGASVREARSEMALVAARLEQAYAENRGRGARVGSLVDYAAGPLAEALRTFLFAVGLVMLIACANVAGLELVRTLGRRREFSIRQALGGTRAVIVRAVVAESLVLSLIAGVVGLFVASWLLDATLASAPPIPRADTLRFDVRVFAFTFAICLVSALVLALPAALLATKLQLSATLKEQASSVAAGAALRTRLAFVGGQVMLALMLLTGAVLTAQTLVRQLALRPGFEPAGLAAFQVFPPLDIYPKGEQVSALYSRFVTEAHHLPGVESAAAVSATPLSGEGAEPVEFSIAISGGMPRTGRANSFNASAGYFETLRARLVRGRDFSDADTRSARPVAIVNESFARRYLPGTEAVGAQVRTEPSGTVVEIIGVAADLLQDLAPRAVPEPELYRPYTQQPRWAAFIVVRSDNAGGMASALKQRIHEADGQISTGTPFLVSERVARSTRGPRFVTMLFAVFSGLAMLLSGIGVSGVVFHTFTQRTKEIALRVTLGASRRDILRLVGGGAFLAVAIGSLVGLAGTILLARVLESALVQLAPLSVADVIAAWVLIVIVGAIACYVPARRALRIDPAEALRLE